jgi:hypothetical protein
VTAFSIRLKRKENRKIGRYLVTISASARNKHFGAPSSKDMTEPSSNDVRDEKVVDALPSTDLEKGEAEGESFPSD